MFYLNFAYLYSMFLKVHGEMANSVDPDQVLLREQPDLGLHLAFWVKNISRQHIEIISLFFPEKRIWHFMQIVSNGDNLHGMLNSVLGKRKKNINN